MQASLRKPSKEKKYLRGHTREIFYTSDWMQRHWAWRESWVWVLLLLKNCALLWNVKSMGWVEWDVLEPGESPWECPSLRRACRSPPFSELPTPILSGKISSCYQLLYFLDTGTLWRLFQIWLPVCWIFLVFYHFTDLILTKFPLLRDILF